MVIKQQKVTDNLKYLWIIGVIILITSILLFGCEFDMTDHLEDLSPVPVEQNPLATIELGNGEYIEFIELTPGDIMVGGMFNSTDADISGIGKPALEAYEYYAGGKAPPELLEAYSRSMEIIENEAKSINRDLINTDKPATDIPDSIHQNRMNGTTFTQNYYDGNPNMEWMTYKACRTYRTGDAAINRYCFTQGMTVHPYRGSLTFRSQTLYGSTWVVNKTKTVNQGSVYAYYVGGSWRKRKSEIYDASGDGYHYLFYGDPVLAQSHWGQWAPYNDDVPGGNRLGCWSVAVAQIARKHQMQPSGRVIYSGTTYNIDVTMNHTFNFSLMPAVVDTDPAEINETSLYCYYAAIICQKDFGTNTYCLNRQQVANEIASHYGCTTALYSTNTYTMAQMEQFIKNEINARRPVWMYINNTAGTSGHAVVIDEYNGSGADFEIHLNMGWYGTDDGFYDFDSAIGAFNNNSFREIITIQP